MGAMAAFLLLPASADLTLADVEAWVARARSLGADDDSVVRVGEPPLESKRDGSLALCVPVTVTRTVLPSGDQPGSRGSATGPSTRRPTRRRGARGSTSRRSDSAEAVEVGGARLGGPATEEGHITGSQAARATVADSPTATDEAEPRSPESTSTASVSPESASPESASTGSTSTGRVTAEPAVPDANAGTTSTTATPFAVRPNAMDDDQEARPAHGRARPTPPPRITFSNPAAI
jgi:hypothetical protein